MSTLTDKHEAALRVLAAASADTFPAVTLAEIEGSKSVPGILDQCVVASVWAPEQQYGVGAVVIPTQTKENGLRYQLELGSSGNESGAIEPIWPQSERWQYAVDGGLLWRIIGGAPEALWDLGFAEHLVWKRKMALAAALSDVGLDARDQFKRSQVFDHCREMFEATAPFCVGVT